MQKYTAFGLTIESEIELPQVIPCDCEKTDVTIKVIPFCEQIGTESYRLFEHEIRLCIKEKAVFRITNGNLIEAFAFNKDTSGLPIFLLGSCMGAIIHQRGDMPLHGSCVSDGDNTILICGESGAGKSTLASVMMQHGWKLLTDDVAVIIDPAGKALVQPSYPSQKMWEDSPSFKGKKESDIHSLYERGGKNKFGVSASEVFVSTPRQLTAFIQLQVSDNPTGITELQGIDKADTIAQNTYRGYMIQSKDFEGHLKKCEALATSIPVFSVNRQDGEDNREELYSLITSRLK